MAARITARWIAEGVLRSDGIESVPVDFTGPVWIDVTEPDAAALDAVSVRFPLPPLAVEDCVARELRFDADLWLVEIENRGGDPRILLAKDEP